MEWELVFDVGLLVVLLFALILKIPVVLAVLSILGTLPVVWSAFKALKKKELSIDLLAVVALGFSILSREWISAAFINLMLTSARLFDVWTQEREKKIVGKLLKYRPEKARLKTGDTEHEVPLTHVKIGDEVIVELGERIPVDGIVLFGQASIDESTLTGESQAVLKKVGSKVFAATLNLSGSLVVRAEKIGADSQFAKIISMVEEAGRLKSPTERLAHKFVGWYILATLVGSGILFYFFRDVSQVLAVLLVVCADDIAVSVPLTFTAAIARSAQHGILLKGSQVLEKLAKIKYFVTDKTGTLTKGHPRVAEITFFSRNPKQILNYLSIASINSSHPVAKSIVEYLKDHKVQQTDPDSFTESPGEGIEAKYKGKIIISGRIEYLKSKGVHLSGAEQTEIEKQMAQGYSLSGLAVNSKLQCLVVLEDALRASAAQIVEQTRQMGVEKWIMLTGDNATVAQRVTNDVHLDGFRANLKPQDKLHFIQDFKKTHSENLAMIGDGVNDAAALAIADVSFAMGSVGSDAAIEAADVAIMHDDLRKVPEAMNLGKQTMRIVMQNFGIWGLTNAIGLALVFTLHLSPAWAAAYNFATDFIPIFNALRMGFV